MFVLFLLARHTDSYMYFVVVSVFCKMSVIIQKRFTPFLHNKTLGFKYLFVQGMCI